MTTRLQVRARDIATLSVREKELIEWGKILYEALDNEPVPAQSDDEVIEVATDGFPSAPLEDALKSMGLDLEEDLQTKRASDPALRHWISGGSTTSGYLLWIDEALWASIERSSLPIPQVRRLNVGRCLNVQIEVTKWTYEMWIQFEKSGGYAGLSLVEFLEAQREPTA